PVIRRAMFGVKIAFPLYNEEVHLLARRSIRSVEELAGKRVAVGDEDSGTFLTSTLVLEFMGVEPSEMRKTDPVASLDALIDGEIDAMFYVTGAPAALFEDERIDPQEYHLLPLTDDTLASVYAPSMVPARTYPWLFEDVPVVSVKALLMTYEFDTSVNAYHRASCNAVAEVSNIILNDFTRLQDGGHPKWRDVDLMDIPPGWSIGSCVTRGLDPGFQSTCERETPPVPLVEEPAVNILYRQRICATLGC
ncbi:MAG: TAXI family TRAP transporter solute-binding subunit, partial [Pseudomonadota bacterium]